MLCKPKPHERTQVQVTEEGDYEKRMHFLTDFCRQYMTVLLKVIMRKECIFNWFFQAVYDSVTDPKLTFFHW
jgi:hypothetical protein